VKRASGSFAYSDPSAINFAGFILRQSLRVCQSPIDIWLLLKLFSFVKTQGLALVRNSCI
jgi:hypothetical protein